MELSDIYNLVAHVVDVVAFRMPLIEKLRYILDVIPVELLDRLGSREAHSDDSSRDVSEVEIELALLDSVPLARHFLLNV